MVTLVVCILAIFCYLHLMWISAFKIIFFWVLSPTNQMKIIKYSCNPNWKFWKIRKFQYFRAIWTLGLYSRFVDFLIFLNDTWITLIYTMMFHTIIYIYGEKFRFFSIFYIWYQLSSFFFLKKFIAISNFSQKKLKK